jgi:hypothetical protein
MEKLKTFATLVGRVLVSGAGLAAAILVIAGGYCFWRGACTANGFADAAINLSLLTAGIGALLTMGGGLLGSGANYQMARSAGAASTAERAQQEVSATSGRLSCALFLLVGGVEAGVIGFIIKGMAGPS